MLTSNYNLRTLYYRQIAICTIYIYMVNVTAEFLTRFQQSRATSTLRGLSKAIQKKIIGHRKDYVKILGHISTLYIFQNHLFVKKKDV